MGTKREVLRWVRRIRGHIDLGGSVNFGIGSLNYFFSGNGSGLYNIEDKTNK